MKKSIFLLIYTLFVFPIFAISANEIFENTLNMQNQTMRGITETKFIDPDGKLTGSRVVESWVLVDKDGLKKKVFAIHKPDNVKGTRSLNVENKGRDDDYWVYLPELQSARRISKSDKSKAFLGAPEGTVTNEDMEIYKANEFNCKLIGEDTVINEPCYVIEVSKKDSSDTQYSKMVYYISKTKWIRLKIEYYDKKGVNTKVSTFKGIKQVNGVWTMEFFEMKNLKTNWSLQYRVNRVAYGDAAKVEPERFTNRFLTTGEIK